MEIKSIYATKSINEAFKTNAKKSLDFTNMEKLGYLTQQTMWHNIACYKTFDRQDMLM